MISNINEIPETTDATEGYWRRFLLIHLSRMFNPDEQDKELKYKLRAESSGVFQLDIGRQDKDIRDKGVILLSLKMEKMVKTIRD